MVSFMTGYWFTLIPLAVVWITALIVLPDTSKHSLAEYITRLVAWGLFVVIILWALAGIWLPVWIPGLY